MTDNDFRDTFQIVSEGGKDRAACTICGRVIANNVGCMRMHYTKVHEQEQIPSRSPREDDDDDSESDERETSVDTPLPLAMDLHPHIERLRALDHDEVVERTVKYLEVCPNPSSLMLLRMLLQTR